ncbi:MAG: hypothetical protein HYY49_11205 [Ignavibacteriales bacterium]|nr:hypothetical protein [Ignavibacteriales bacterium]
MRIASKTIILFLPFTCLIAQEGTFSVSGSYARGIMSMGSVNSTLDRTVFNWNSVLGLSMAPFDHFNSLGTVTAKIAYRYDRDFGLFVSYFRFSNRVDNGFHGDGSLDGDRYDLALERSLGSENLALGVAYFFPPLEYEAEAYAFVEAGSVRAFAQAKTFGTQTVKNAESDSTFVFHNVVADYSKTRMFVGVGTGVSIPLFSSFRATAEARYTVAKIGKIDGRITVEQGTFDDPSVSEFDFSLLLLSIGLSLHF